MIVLFVALSLNNVLAYSKTPNKSENNNNIPTLCKISIKICHNDISFIHQHDINITNQTDLILEQVNSTKLKEWINTLSSFHTRHTKSEHIEDVAYWLKNELETLCESKVFVHNFTQRENMQTFHLKNIICALKDSTESSRDNATIIIGAHYDSRAENINNTDARAPGADDNASGVSAILELVRILSHVKLKLNLELVLFSGEEQGKWGSENYVKYLNNNNRTQNIELYINFDMIGYRPTNESNKVILEYDIGNKHLQNDNYSKTIALFIKHISSNYTNLNVQLAKLGNSDFIPFEALGHTVIGIHDGGVTENPNYHKSSDTPNTLNIEYVTSITKMILATILELDRLSLSLQR
jgi:hypothetical protein